MYFYCYQIFISYSQLCAKVKFVETQEKALTYNAFLYFRSIPVWQGSWIH